MSTSISMSEHRAFQVEEATAAPSVDVAAAAAAPSVTEELTPTIVESAVKTDSVRLSAPIPGFAEYTVQEQYAFTRWLKEVGEIYEMYGFTPVHLRPLERLAALKGETENQKQIFGVSRVTGNLDTGLALPFDHTVPLALYVAAHAVIKRELTLPYKRYDLGLSYRGERPQLGRFRAFVQADVDIVGRKLSLSADAECLCTLIKALQVLQLGKFHVCINHINIVKGMIRSAGVPESHQAEILRVIDKLDKHSPDAVVKEILDIKSLDLSEKEVVRLVSCFTAPSCSIDDYMFDQDYGTEATEGLSQLKEAIRLLEMMGIDPSLFKFTPGMVRGLDYYTGIVFETFLNGKEHLGSIASGGRYSDLVGRFATDAKDIEGVGGSIGLTRLFEIAGKGSVSKRRTTADVLVGYRTEGQRLLACRVCTLLRDNNFKVDAYSGAPNVKQMLTHANTLGVPFSVVVMGDDAIVVKDMFAPEDREKKREPDLRSPEETLQKLMFLRDRV